MRQGGTYRGGKQGHRSHYGRETGVSGVYRNDPLSQKTNHAQKKELYQLSNKGKKREGRIESNEVQCRIRRDISCGKRGDRIPPDRSSERNEEVQGEQGSSTRRPEK